ncbi:MAG: peptidylprolyl isomerase [Aquabacterium sp.]|nr:peptidylprolyl isomerase [Aquabacterium sp.]
MSTVPPAPPDLQADLATNPSPQAQPAARRHPAAAWLREPLLHFTLLGAALFAIDAAVVSRTEDPRVITIDAAVDAEAVRVFRDARGRAPDQDELYALRRVWLDNEVLYREGLALQMDKGDKAIRDRVIFKALSTINAGLKLPPVDEATLRAWFEKNRIKYDEPPRLDFSEAIVPEASPTEAMARALAATLNASSGGEANAGLRVFKGRPQANIVQSYGADFSQALEKANAGEWQALRQGESWRVVRLDGASAPKLASFENLRGVVLQDWTDAVMADQRGAAVKAMALKYRIQTEAAQP